MVVGFELEDEDKNTMENIWPAGTEAAKNASISAVYAFTY
jgi:hypothetical protein